jgi:hypothetical protein
MKDSTLDQFFERSELACALSDTEKTKLESFQNNPKEPIFIQILIGAGAWLASLFIMLFIGVSDIVGDEMGAVALGIMTLITGLVLRKFNTTFFHQLSLAMVSTAHILIMYGTTNMSDMREIALCLLIHLGLTIVVYPFYESSIYRFVAPFTVTLLAFFWQGQEHVPIVFHILVFCQILAISMLLLQTKWSKPLRPLAYSGLFGLPTILMLAYEWMSNSFSQRDLIPSGPATIMVCIGLIVLICYLSDDWRTNKTSRALILITIFLSLFTTPAILTGVGLLVLGHGLQKTLISVLAYGYLPLSLTCYYYFMGVDLSQKSWVMMASGLLLLGTRFGLSKLPQQQEVSQ